MITFLRHWWNRSGRTHARKPDPQPRLNLEHMEGRDLPSAFINTTIALASYNGQADSTATLSSAVTVARRLPTITPFPGYRGPLSVAVGDVNGDGVPDLIVGAQAPNGHVKVFDGSTGNLLQSFFAFPGFNGSVSVGSADVNADGYADVLVAADATNAHVKAFSGADGTPLASFYAFPGFLGEVSVSGADFDHDGAAEIIVGAGGPGANGRVAIFNGSGGLVDPGFFAFPGFCGPISVAGGDVTGDGIADVVVGAGKGSPGGPVKVFSGAGFATINSFVPFVPSMTDGVDVQLADGNLDGRLDIFISIHPGGSVPLTTAGTVPVAAFDGLTGQPLAQFAAGPGTCPDNGSVDVNNGGGDNLYVPPVFIPAPDPGTIPPPFDPGIPSDPGTDPTPTDPTDPGDVGGPYCPDPGLIPDPTDPTA